jgi:hypothetical protein
MMRPIPAGLHRPGTPSDTALTPDQRDAVTAELGRLSEISRSTPSSGDPAAPDSAGDTVADGSQDNPFMGVASGPVGDQGPSLTDPKAFGGAYMGPSAFGAYIDKMIDPTNLVQNFLNGSITSDMLSGEKGKYLMMQIEQRQQLLNQMYEAFSNIMKNDEQARQKAVDNLR